MNVTTTYYRDFNNYHWFTRIGKFSFYSVTKPTARQIRRWKKMTKRVNWFEYKATVNADYGKFGHDISALQAFGRADRANETNKAAFIRGRRLGFSYTDQSMLDAITLGNKIHQGEHIPNKTIWQHVIDRTAHPSFLEIFDKALVRELAGFPVIINECNAGIGICYHTDGVTKDNNHA